jgi:predicted transcriptional regulator
MKHLKGIDFPVDKKHLIMHAKKAEGPDTDQVIEVLDQIEEKKYNSPAEVMHEVGKVE